MKTMLEIHMSDLGLLGGYKVEDESELPQMSFRKMFRLSLRTWPYMRPMLKHLVVVLAFALSGGLLGMATGFIGTDLFTNKVLIGEKLQPIQATVLFVGDEYVTTDPVKLGQGPRKESSAKKATGKGKGTLVTAAEETEYAEPELTQGQRRTVRNRLLIWGVIGGIFSAIILSAFYYYTTWIWQSINQNLRVAMVESAENLSLKYHDSARVGDAIFRVYQDSSMIVNLLQSGIIYPLMTLYGVIIGLVFIAAFDPWFALMAIMVAIPIGCVIVASTSRIRRRSLANRVANSDLTSGAQEIFAAIKVVKANRAERQVFDRFNSDSTRALNTAYFLRLDMVLLTAIVALLGGGMVIFSEYIMVTWVLEKRETFLGAMVATFIGFVMWNYGAILIARGRVEGLAGSGRGLLGMWMRMQDLFIALDRAFYLLDLEPDVVDPANPVDFPAPIQRVSWQSVGFGYDNSRPILKGVDLNADAGTVTAIVGTTGSGKSTLMSLLLRLYDPDEGVVQVNGTDIRDMTIDDIRANTAIALQKNVLFTDTVANNISFGATQVTQEAVTAAAKIACADDFVLGMSHGYDTELGERGGKLSAGQRQRLSIARAVIRDTPILILDEPTASLDARTEQQVLSNLAAWGKEKVIFLITHRLSTIRGADQIAFLEDGKIVELGQHEELMARGGGRYRAFVDAELEGTEVDHE
jgi:ABC-type multidrug transport system fused ATPase/permease subunit